MKKIKTIWRLVDGKAGHDKQSLALVENLKNQARCKIFDINIQNIKNPFIAIIFKKYNLDKGLINPDIAIGAGHKTHLYLLAIKRCFGAKIVVIIVCCLLPRNAVTHCSMKPYFFFSMFNNH